MTTTTTQLDARRTGAWRHEVLDRAGRLEQELPEYGSPESADEVPTARQNIKAAERIAGDPTWRPQGWSGRSTENAWRHLRLAEEALTHLAAEHPVRRHELAAMTAMSQNPTGSPAGTNVVMTTRISAMAANSMAANGEPVRSRMLVTEMTALQSRAAATIAGSLRVIR